VQQTLELFNKISPTESRPLFPPPGLKPPGALVVGEWGNAFNAFNVVHQVHWAIDRRRISAKSSERQLVSPAFELSLAGSPDKAFFRMMLHARGKGHQHRAASFKSSGGRCDVLLKCETPDKVGETLQCRLWVGNGVKRPPSSTLITHDFSASSVCDLSNINVATAGDLSLSTVTVCVELLPPSDFFPTTDQEDLTEQKQAPSHPMRIQETHASDGRNSAVNASYKTQPCRFYRSKKGCSKGALCTYAHDASELQGELSQTSECYKTRLCAALAKTGACSLGDFCTFAHGNDELVQRGKQREDLMRMNAAANVANAFVVPHLGGPQQLFSMSLPHWFQQP